MFDAFFSSLHAKSYSVAITSTSFCFFTEVFILSRMPVLNSMSVLSYPSHLLPTPTSKQSNTMSSVSFADTHFRKCLNATDSWNCLPMPSSTFSP